MLEFLKEIRKGLFEKDPIKKDILDRTYKALDKLNNEPLGDSEAFYETRESLRQSAWVLNAAARGDYDHPRKTALFEDSMLSLMRNISAHSFSLAVSFALVQGGLEVKDHIFEEDQVVENSVEEFQQPASENIDYNLFHLSLVFTLSAAGGALASRRRYLQLEEKFNNAETSLEL